MMYFLIILLDFLLCLSDIMQSEIFRMYHTIAIEIFVIQLLVEEYLGMDVKLYTAFMDLHKTTSNHHEGYYENVCQSAQLTCMAKRQPLVHNKIPLYCILLCMFIDGYIHYKMPGYPENSS